MNFCKIDYFILFFYGDGEIMSIPLEKCMIYCKNRQRAYIKLGIPIWNFKFKDIQRSRTWSRKLWFQVTHSFKVPSWHFKIERAIKMADTEQTALTKANNDNQEINIESAE